MVADRVAVGRRPATALLALNLGCQHVAEDTCRDRTRSLADRARLLGAEFELGLHHYEGRNWRGFHHHASLWIAAYGSKKFVPLLESVCKKTAPRRVDTKELRAHAQHQLTVSSNWHFWHCCSEDFEQTLRTAASKKNDVSV